MSLGSHFVAPVRSLARWPTSGSVAGLVPVLSASSGLRCFVRLQEVRQGRRRDELAEPEPGCRDGSDQHHRAEEDALEHRTTGDTHETSEG